MIADDDDDVLLIEARALQPREQPCQLLVREADLAVVETGQTAAAELGRNGSGGSYGLCASYRWTQAKNGTCLLAVEPVERGIHHLVGRPLYRGEVEMLELFQIELVVVDAKALIQPPAAVEHERANERAGLVPVLRERFGQRRLRLAERGGAVQAHAVIRGIEARHDRGMRRQRQRRGRRGLREEDAAPRERVERRRPRILASP